MEEPTSIPPIPGSGEPRYCPECGTRVADLASTCLICGASLDVEDDGSGDEGRKLRFQIPWRGLFAGVLTAAAFLALIGWLVRAQIVGPRSTPTLTLTATMTPRPTRPSTPTSTPSPTLTFTPVPPRVHQVQSGETCISIAVAYDISLDLLITMNPEKCGSGGIIRPGDPLLVPAWTPTPGPTSTVGPGTPSPTSECPTLHIVDAGDTGLSIAERYEVSFNLIEAANPQVNFEQLPINMVLQIPCVEPSPSPTPTVDPNATPTPIPKYSAPALLSPADGATVTGSLVPLQWTAVNLLREGETYAVRLRPLDKETSLESIHTTTNLVRLGEEYAPTPEDPVREYSWEVTVVRFIGTSASGQSRYAAASYPSLQRTFRWMLKPIDAAPDVTLAP